MLDFHSSWYVNTRRDENGVVDLLQNEHRWQCRTQGHLPKEGFPGKAFRQQL